MSSRACRGRRRRCRKEKNIGKVTFEGREKDDVHLPLLETLPLRRPLRHTHPPHFPPDLRACRARPLRCHRRSSSSSSSSSCRPSRDRTRRLYGSSELWLRDSQHLRRLFRCDPRSESAGTSSSPMSTGRRGERAATARTGGRDGGDGRDGASATSARGRSPDGGGSGRSSRRGEGGRGRGRSRRGGEGARLLLRFESGLLVDLESGDDGSRSDLGERSRRRLR